MVLDQRGLSGKAGYGQSCSRGGGGDSVRGWMDRELDARASEDAVGARRHMGPLPLPPQSGMSASTVALTLSEL